MSIYDDMRLQRGTSWNIFFEMLLLVSVEQLLSIVSVL